MKSMREMINLLEGVQSMNAYSEFPVDKDPGVEELKLKAREYSKNGYGQHVNVDPNRGPYISDWFDDDETVASYENGRPVGISASEMEETAPPGEEHLVKDLKKEYPGHEDKAFATAWSIYNKKHGKTEEDTGMEEGWETPRPGAIRAREIEGIKKLTFNQGYKDGEIASETGNPQMNMDAALELWFEYMDQSENGNFDTAISDQMEQAYKDGFAKGFGAMGENAEIEEGHWWKDPEDDPEEVPQVVLDSAVNIIDHYMEQGLDLESALKKWASDLQSDGTNSENLGRLMHEVKTAIEQRDMTGDPLDQDDLAPMEEDIQNGYNDRHAAQATDYFPNGSDGPIATATGPSGAKTGDNPEQKKMQVAETHKELVYKYRNYLKESSKK